MPETARPSLPTSSSDFALPPTTASSSALTLAIPTAADLNPFMLRIRRPSLLSPRVTYYSDSRAHSPLATAAPVQGRGSARNRTRGSINGEESESDKEKMSMDSPPTSDSGNTTPLLLPSSMGLEVGSGGTTKTKRRPQSPATPPPKSSSAIPIAVQDSVPRNASRRLSHPVSVPVGVS